MDQIKFCFLLKLPGFAVEETKGMRGQVWGSKQWVLKAFPWSSDSRWCAEGRAEHQKKGNSKMLFSCTLGCGVAERRVNEAKQKHNAEIPIKRAAFSRRAEQGCAAAGRGHPSSAWMLSCSCLSFPTRLGAQAGDAGAALPPRSTQGSSPVSAVPLSGGGAAWRGQNFPAERRRPAASPLSPGVGTLRPVGRDRRRGFRSFLQQLVIDFSGRNIFAFRRPCHKPSASAGEKQMES